MGILGFVQGRSTPAVEALPVPTGLELRVQDTLAAGDRLWVRGRLVQPLLTVEVLGTRAAWWQRNGPPLALPVLHLETQVAGKALAAEPLVGPQGEFEATFTLPLAPSRRGWRVARNRITFAGQSAEACGLVLTPPTEATGAVVVILPRADTLEGDGAQRLERSHQASRLTAQLRRLHHGPWGRHPIYYLACVPGDGEGQQAELALAATSLNWPSGHFVLLPTDAASADTALRHALDRLRWLFAGSLELLLINLDPLSRPLVEGLAPMSDRAAVNTLVVPEDESGARLREIRPDIPSVCGVAVRPARSGLVTRHPIVFCHGMLACTMLRMQMPKDYNYFIPLRKFLQERGFRALFPLVLPTGGVAERAKQLREQILSWTDEPVNIVAHSMGGLDARYLISRLDMADRVTSLTTVGTPHRGSYMADWFLANFRNRVPLLLALEAVGVCVDGFRDCRPAICREFNERTPDMPNVRYFSYAGEVPFHRVTPMLRRAWEMLTPLEGPNDGLVSVASARWGEFLGTIAADHFAQTPDGLFIHPEEDFDGLGFFTRLVENLARRGF